MRIALEHRAGHRRRYDALTKGEAKNPGADLSPKELLIGSWKMKVAIDDTRLEQYLAGGGIAKIRRNRSELLDELKRVVATEVTMEFQIDGTLIQTSKRDGGACRNSRRLEGPRRGHASLTIETGYDSSEGFNKLRAIEKRQIAFQNNDRFTMPEAGNQGMPLTTPIWTVRCRRQPGIQG